MAHRVKGWAGDPKTVGNGVSSWPDVLDVVDRDNEPEVRCA
jgi:hypothetical protein